MSFVIVPLLTFMLFASPWLASPPNRPESARHKPGGRELPRPNTSRQGRSAAAEAAADSQHLAASTEAKGANEAREDIGANDSVMTAAQEDEMRRSLRTQRGQR